jgi:transcriptional regulator with XRE-family HTH domain
MRYPETAALIKSARLRKGLSQEKAAQQVGCSRLQWINWEQGVHRPGRHAAALAGVLGITLDELRAADDEEEAALQPLSRDDFTMLGALMARLGTTLSRVGA